MTDLRLNLRMPEGVVIQFSYDEVNNVAVFGNINEVARLIEYIIDKNSDVAIDKDNIIICDFSENIKTDEATVVHGTWNCVDAMENFARQIRMENETLQREKRKSVEQYEKAIESLKCRLIVLHGYEDMVKSCDTKQRNIIASSLASIFKSGCDTGKHLILTCGSMNCCEKEIIAACNGRITITGDTAIYSEIYQRNTTFSI